MPDIASLPLTRASHITPGVNAKELIVFHTNEGPESKGSAQSLANYCARPDKTPGYHVMVDSETTVRGAPDDQIPWGAGGVNSRALHICIVGYSNQKLIDWLDPFDKSAFVLAADVIRQWSQKYGIPVDRHYTDAPAVAGRRGLCGHVDVSRYHPESQGHTDPGQEFPWDTLIAAIKGAQQGPSPQDIENYFRMLEAMDVEHGMAVNATFEPGNKPKPRGYVLDRWGGVTAVNGAKPLDKAQLAYWQARDCARQIIVTDWETPSGFIMDLNGGLWGFGACFRQKVDGAPYWPSGRIVEFSEL